MSEVYVSEGPVSCDTRKSVSDLPFERPILLYTLNFHRKVRITKLFVIVLGRIKPSSGESFCINGTDFSRTESLGKKEIPYVSCINTTKYVGLESPKTRSHPYMDLRPPTSGLEPRFIELERTLTHTHIRTCI